MPTINLTRNYEDGTILFQSDLDAFLDDLESFLNTTKIDNSNIQDGGIDGSLKLTTASVVESKLASAAVTTSKIADDAVTTAKILAANVTTAKIADSNVTTAKIADSNVTTAKIADSNVTTAKIADGAVTQAKRAALGHQLSGESGGGNDISGGWQVPATSTWTDVPNHSISITTTGRPIRIVLVPLPGGTGFPAFLSASNNGTSAYVRATRDGSTVATTWVGDAKIPPSSVEFIDTPAAGTYTYKIQALAVSGQSFYINGVCLLVYEL